MPRVARPLVAAATLLTFALAAPDAVALSGVDPLPTPAPTPTPFPAPTPQPVQTTGVRDPDPKHLPDLGLGKVGDLRLIRTPSGSLQLRLSSTLINVGSGPLVVRATRERAKGGFTVEQRVRTLDGRRPFFDLPIGTKYAGDGHSHWHIKDVVRYTLSPRAADADVRDRRIQKIGFCIYDNIRRADRPGRPVRPEFLRTGCGRQDSTTLRMGLSVGWGDLYEWTLPGQFISMTGLPAGDYRLLGEANPEDVFYEQRDDNNFVFVDFRFRRENGKATIKILNRGVRPTAETSAVAEDHSGHADPPGSGAPVARKVDYAAWPSTSAPSTQSSPTRSRKAPSRA